MFIKILLIGCSNDHVNTIKEFDEQLAMPGWSVDCSLGVWIYDISTCMNWYCWNSWNVTGSIGTKLYGNGHGRLDFGNCWNTGIVRVLLNGTEIASASSNTPSTIIEFDFDNGETLEIIEEHIGIIQFNQFDVLSCNLT